MSDDVFFMRRAFRLAKRGEGMVSPNPCVGAVVVSGGNIVGEGYHRRFGGPHAEVVAIAGVPRSLLGKSTLYVTLEPCCHHGKTPPCTGLILEKKIRRVVVGVSDVNPRVAGRGIALLRRNGVNVTTGVLEEELSPFYRPFFKYIGEGMPFVTLKVAQSIDGKNSVNSGPAYLTSEQSLRLVHRLRFMSDAVMVGVNTVLRDDPSLDIRMHRRTKPLIKVVLDSRGRLTPKARIFETPGPVIIYTAAPRKGSFPPAVEVVRVAPSSPGMLDLQEVLRDLGARGIQNLLVEGGGTLSFTLLHERLADRLMLFVAPLVIGGRDHPSFSGSGYSSLTESFSLDRYDVKRVGRDLLITADFF